MPDAEWGSKVVVRRRLKALVVSLLITSDKEDFRCVCGLLKPLPATAGASSGFMAVAHWVDFDATIGDPLCWPKYGECYVN